MKYAALALSFLFVSNAHAGLGDIMNNAYLVLCQSHAEEGKTALAAMPADQQAEVQAGRAALLTFLADPAPELERFRNGSFSSKEKAKEAGEAQLRRDAKHFISTCGMTMLFGAGMEARGCHTAEGVNAYKAGTARQCESLIHLLDDNLPPGFDLR